MGKGGTVLGLIGIIIGAGGLVFGYMAWSSIDTSQTNLVGNDAWYSIKSGPFTVTPAYTVIELSILNVSFELDYIASIYLSFTCRAEINPGVSYSSIFFFFKVDDVDIINPSSRVGNNQGGSTSDYFSVNLQHFIENMAAGSHNVTLEVSTESAGGLLREMTLFVQSFS